jgi:aryl-alcohol dehydrogenase-like predicted oxidoreductase
MLQQAFGPNPQGVVYATKFGYDITKPDQENRGQRALPHRLDSAYIRAACEASLRRLGIDAIPMWQLHNADLDAVLNDELWQTLYELQSEGKILHYGAAVGPANGWITEGNAAMERRNIASLQIIYNLLEQYPGNAFFAAAQKNEVGLLVRVPHSSGMLEGHYTAQTQFDKNDHRRHRPRSWLLNGIQKVETLQFLTENRGQTLGQAALKFVLAEKSVVSTLPNIYDVEQLKEFAAAPDLPDLTDDDLNRIAQLTKTNFGVEEAPMKLKGVPQTALQERVAA